MIGDIIRVPRTTATFINGLGRILREEMGYPVYIEECWIFTHTAQWEECGRKGQCTIHDTDKCSETDHYYGQCQCALPCYEYTHNTYMGEGFFRTKGHRVEVRCRISLTHRDAGGDLIDIELWLRQDQSPIQASRFQVWSDGNFWSDTEKLPAPLPPNRFSFWKGHPGVKSKRRSRRANRLQHLLRHHNTGHRSAVALLEALQKQLVPDLQG